ncbi:M23 family metallopeptidase [Agrilutibacter solisilvae]|uniref:Peptidoglycan DD-metalloendopeptidase family protein n=1 Tax=Agrilutibacter solisilvae TaxID=2763317 RepID=A0A975ATD8_9GAMM|nr:peptidoglycan DD-metalloendopeptidase family protein [Lysobacter solisilvae]QSX79014.1 peptidoglycan DD-metalloendopeptidase family protein [Lysobacter solisilvae]
MINSEARAQRRQRLDALRESVLHRPVLARHLSEGFNGRWSRRQWAHASLFATLGMLVAAIVPGFRAIEPATPLTPALHSMALPLPTLPMARLRGQPGDSWQAVRVERGQTLGALFEQFNIPAATLQRVMKQPGARESLSRLKPGMELQFDVPVPAPGQQVALRGLRFDRGDSHRVELSLDGENIREKVIERQTETRTVVLSGKVGRSLFRSARKLGLSPSNVNTLTGEIFKYDIDFNEDVGANDRFSVVVEQTWREGELVKTGPVLAATFTTGKKLHSGFRFERNGKPEYFTGDGRPLKKSFIRMPIPYARLTSGFGARRHPVLGRMRMHKGVDYAAGTGTPIMAAGDARVVSAGWQGGYGNAVVLDHGRGYTTLYGHMSRLGKIKRGQRIGQGTVIGYVGTTGMSTGPHLHYEFRINGVHRNPLSITMPPPEPLTGGPLAQFRKQTSVALARIQEVENIIYADVSPVSSKVAAVASKPGKKG